jgi:hypothetical protein
VAHSLHRPTPMGQCVLINAGRNNDKRRAAPCAPSERGPDVTASSGTGS